MSFFNVSLTAPVITWLEHVERTLGVNAMLSRLNEVVDIKGSEPAHRVWLKDGGSFAEPVWTVKKL